MTSGALTSDDTMLIAGLMQAHGAAASAPTAAPAPAPTAPATAAGRFIPNPPGGPQPDANAPREVRRAWAVGVLEWATQSFGDYLATVDAATAALDLVTDETAALEDSKKDGES